MSIYDEAVAQLGKEAADAIRASAQADPLMTDEEIDRLIPLWLMSEPYVRVKGVSGSNAAR
ncbi:hypothetical protein GCM10009836_68920 [Pseudonocardia ailaonensis]|uniref:Uncharacterized protein n=1 Tax=Pseudonocardia ailaonensis TaxID=367279 RepID=A0ABN2NQL4_9PSEU